MEIVGKYFIRNENDTPLKIVNIDNGFAIFENDARCKIETIMNEFKEVNNISLNNSNNKDYIDPDTFFNTPLDKTLVSEVAAPTIRNSVDVTPNENGTMQSYLEQRLSPDYNESNTSNSNNNPPAQQVQQLVSNRPLEWDMFDRIKKTESITFEIPFTIKLPKAEKIDVINDLYETSYLGYVAKQFIQDLLKNDKALLIDLHKKLEEWVDESLNNKQSSKKIIKKTKKNKEEIIESKSIPVEQIITSTDDLTTQLYGNSKMVVLENDDDLKRIKSRISELQDKDDQESILELDALESMVITYTTNKQ